MYIFIQTFDTSDIRNKGLKSNLFLFLFISFKTFDLGQLQDSMQDAAWTFDTSDIPWTLQNLLFFT